MRGNQQNRRMTLCHVNCALLSCYHACQQGQHLAVALNRQIWNASKTRVSECKLIRIENFQIKKNS